MIKIIRSYQYSFTVNSLTAVIIGIPLDIQQCVGELIITQVNQQILFIFFYYINVCSVWFDEATEQKKRVKHS